MELFLDEVLMKMREEEFPHKVDMDTALIRLRSKTGRNLASLASDESLGCHPDEVRANLESHLRHHSLACVLFNKKSQREAAQIWSQLVKMEIEDEDFPGVDFLAGRLLK